MKTLILIAVVRVGVTRNHCKNATVLAEANAGTAHGNSMCELTGFEPAPPKPMGWYEARLPQISRNRTRFSPGSDLRVFQSVVADSRG